jgi:hypothetical protein
MINCSLRARRQHWIWQALMRWGLRSTFPFTRKHLRTQGIQSGTSAFKPSDQA